MVSAVEQAYEDVWPNIFIIEVRAVSEWALGLLTKSVAPSIYECETKSEPELA
jgi:hypothetical protein